MSSKLKFSIALKGSTVLFCSALSHTAFAALICSQLFLTVSEKQLKQAVEADLTHQANFRLAAAEHKASGTQTELREIYNLARALETSTSLEGKNQALFKPEVAESFLRKLSQISDPIEQRVFIVLVSSALNTYVADSYLGLYNGTRPAPADVAAQRRAQALKKVRDSVGELGLVRRAVEI